MHLRSEHIIVQFIFEIKQLLTFMLAIGKRPTVHLRSKHVIVRFIFEIRQLLTLVLTIGDTIGAP